MSDVREDSAARAAESGADPTDDNELKVVPLRHPVTWVGMALALLICAMMLHGLVTNTFFQWDLVVRYLFDPRILRGMGMTLELTALAMAVGLILGTVLAAMQSSSSRLLQILAHGYIWFFRGTPVLVQLIFWYNFAALYPRIGLGIPFGPQFVSFDVNSLISPLTAAILGLGLNQAAYTAEIIRGGILAVGRGQREAALALGTPNGQMFRRIILPQAMKVVIPPVGNEVISMLKGTSLVSVISLAELLYTAQLIYSANYQTIPLLIVVSIWYLCATTVLTIGQRFVESRFSRELRAEK